MKIGVQIFLTVTGMLLTFASKAQCTLVSDCQMLNARSTGYAIVAARNPGIKFSIYVIPWDKVNTLETNANNQINAGWHAQAAIKGNFFSQSFDGSNFTQYSSVVTSQADFDAYKSTGTQWWIVCSDLPPFSSCVNGDPNGNLYIPKSLLATGTLQSAGTIGLALVPTTGDALVVRNNPGNLVLCSGGGSSEIRLNYSNGGGNGGVLIFDGGNSRNTRLSVNSNGNFLISPSGGNVGIGTTADPDAKLAVKGNVHCNEVKVDLTGAVAPDYVFESAYQLPALEELSAYLKANKHLPEVPSARTMEENGVNLGEMNMLLLKKVEELTLYLLEQQKTNLEQSKQIEQLQQQVGKSNVCFEGNN